MSGTPPQVRLTSEQVQAIVRAAAAGASEVVLLLPETLARRRLPPKAVWEQRMRDLAGEGFSLSLARGLMLLQRLADGGAASAETLAGELGLSHDATGRYLHTLTLAGLVEQDRDTSRYRLVG